MDVLGLLSRYLSIFSPSVCLSIWLFTVCLAVSVWLLDSRNLGLPDCLSIWRSDFLTVWRPEVSDCVTVWLPGFQIQDLVSVHACSRLNSASQLTTNVKMMETVILERSAAAMIVSKDVKIQVLKRSAVRSNLSALLIVYRSFCTQTNM